jgi:predicted DNA-binding transcriptional regulator YafY
MSFAKASDLLRLAEIAAARHLGVSLLDIVEEFGCDYRTAQRMTRALELAFPAVTTQIDAERRKFWRLPGRSAALVLAQGLRSEELTALEIAIRQADRDGAAEDAGHLRRLRDRLISAMPAFHARRAETDAKALLVAHGFASRPGPRVQSAPGLLDTIAEALKGPRQLAIVYDGGGAARRRARVVEPYGLLLGTRRYLVARDAARNGPMRHFRLDRITEARGTGISFVRDAAFDLEAHAARAFGSFHDEGEYGEVVWRFSPAAAPVAREFVFHPRQEMTEEADGALVVRFMASGHLEMAWHLYQWGAEVEVVAPERLRLMTEARCRGDFPALP